MSSSSSQQFAAVAPYVASSASLAHMVSIWTLVIITVDRYIAVCLPGEVQLRTVRRAKVAVAYINVLSVVCCLPLFLNWKHGTADVSVQCDETRPKSVIIANPGSMNYVPELLLFLNITSSETVPHQEQVLLQIYRYCS